jgi:4-hydroxyphenylpyruvate dioxygenase-like putative hemolysin
MKSLIPPVPHRFDHLEVATADILSTENLFEKLGFCTTQVRETSQYQQKLMIQGRIRVLLTQGSVGTYQYNYHTKNGEGICSLGYHVDSAKKTLHVLKQNKSSVAQEFATQEDDVMFLQSSAVDSVADMRVTFVTRSGAPHDVLSPFAPHFKKLDVDYASKNVGLLTFLSIVDPDQIKKQIQITFSCQDIGKTTELLKHRGLNVMDDGYGLGLELFAGNKSAQLLLHFRKI